MWLSLFGFVACVVIMFLIDWISSLVTFGIVLALYMIVVYRKPDVNWVGCQPPSSLAFITFTLHHSTGIHDAG